MKRYRDYKIELPDYETAMALLSCVENKATSIGKLLIFRIYSINIVCHNRCFLFMK